jgi:glutathione peroxidase
MEHQTEFLYNIPLVSIDGTPTSLKPYQGKALLIVNVASRCGFTPQYAELEKLYQDYKNRGFEVLGFPCDQFLRQEPGSNQEIQQFAESCYRITFPLFAKIDVKGANQSPLYGYLKEHIEKRPFKFIPWNFTKILVTPEGHIPCRYLPTVSFKKIRQDIENILPH